jgi:hypothetical protein
MKPIWFKGLKNGKYSGIDGVINEYIKYTIYDMLHIYVLLLNIILDKGIISEKKKKYLKFSKNCLLLVFDVVLSSFSSLN